MAARRRGQPQDDDRAARPEVAPRRAGRGRLGALRATASAGARRFARRPAPRKAGNVPSSEPHTERHRHRPRGARRNVAQHRFTLFSPYLEIYIRNILHTTSPRPNRPPRTLRDLSRTMCAARRSAASGRWHLDPKVANPKSGGGASLLGGFGAKSGILPVRNSPYRTLSGAQGPLTPRCHQPLSTSDSPTAAWQLAPGLKRR